MLKRGQIESNVILYALVAIVAALVLVLGYRSIVTISGKVDESALMELKAELKRDVAGIEYGDVKTYSYALPKGVNGLCFIDRATHPDCSLPLFVPSCTHDPSAPLIRDLIDNTNDNIILQTNNAPESFYMEGIRLNCCAYHCTEKIANMAQIKLEGKGDIVLVS